MTYRILWRPDAVRTLSKIAGENPYRIMYEIDGEIVRIWHVGRSDTLR